MSATSPRAGEVTGWPKLEIRYPTDPAAIAALLPPGLEPCGEAVVAVNVYCAPVHGEPELGISTRIPARFQGEVGSYTLGIGIDQESAIFISRDTNGQPKHPCDLRYFRLGDVVEARATHQGHTFFQYRGTVEGPPQPVDEPVAETEWWIKVSPAVGGAPGAYDLPPRVVAVRTGGRRVEVEPLDGELTLRDSPWDPLSRLLPATGPAGARLVTTRLDRREITVAGPLDPEGFAPFVDTIGGSRWPGHRGGPRP